MKVREVIARLNGISTPIGGVSWTPPVADVEVARRLLVYLEDRRVLYVPWDAEVPAHCIESVLEIRRFLTGELMAGGIADELAAPLKAMRAACRKFLHECDRIEAEWGPLHPGDTGTPGWCFHQAVGEMRGTFGVHVGLIAATYGLDVPDELSAILPLRDADDEEPPRRRRSRHP